MNELTGLALVGVDGKPVAEWRLEGGAAVVTHGADTQVAEEMAAGIRLDEPYLTSARHIGAAHGVSVKPGWVRPADGAAYLVAIMAWTWHHRGVKPVPLVGATA